MANLPRRSAITFKVLWLINLRNDVVLVTNDSLYYKNVLASFTTTYASVIMG